MVRTISFAILVGLLFSLTVFAVEEKLKIGMKAPEFSLKDAEDKDYTLAKLKGSVIVLIMGNREIRKEDDKWAEAIQKDFKKNKKVKTFIIADMRSVPRFIPKGLVKWNLKRNKPPATLLLDWKGKTHIAYKTQKKKPNIFLIDKSGVIIYHLNANFKNEAYKQVKAEVEKALTRKETKVG